MKKSLLKKIKTIETKAITVANSINVGCKDSASQRKELARLANELGCYIRAVEAI